MTPPALPTHQNPDDYSGAACPQQPWIVPAGAEEAGDIRDHPTRPSKLIEAFDRERSFRAQKSIGLCIELLPPDN